MMFDFIGGIFQAGGALAESQDRAWQLEDEAIAATKNARLSREAGAFDAAKHDMEAERIFGGIKADFGASGVESDSTSVFETLRSNHFASELDRQNILYGAETKAQNYEERARAARAGAKSAINAGKFNAFAALFGGAANSAMKYGGGSSSGGSAYSTGSTGGGYGSAGGSYSDTGAIA